MEVRGSAEVSGVQVQVSGVQVQVLTMCVLQMRMQGLSPENETITQGCGPRIQQYYNYCG